ncbi:MAG: ATP synthase F1 subunit epsilon [Chitinophagaceae bacterium]|nr:MAG: ATP synthase F1 subunit epsilon [Chitinophagaceae bacterium]
MQLNILSPEGSIFSGDAYGVQMPGVSGSFEVLEKHAPLIAALKEGTVKVIDNKQHQAAGKSFSIQGGFVEVLHNKVTILVEGAKEL